MSTYNPRMQKATFSDSSIEELTLNRIYKRIARLDGMTSMLVTFHPGASVTEDWVKPGLAGEFTSCPAPHIAYVLKGALGVRQDDGSEEEFHAGDVMMLPPFHEAWTIGDEECVFVEFSRGGDEYYADAMVAPEH